MISAEYIEDNSTINNMGHALRIEKINSDPLNIIPGNEARVEISLMNNAGLYLDDVRVKLILPSGFNFFDDVNQVKITRLESRESKNISFKVIASQSISEGIYEASLVIDYVSYLGKNFANVGQNKEDNFTFGLVVKANPNIIAQVEKTDIYKGNNLGGVTITFVNNGVGNAKFFTTTLLDSEDYEIISNNLDYIGDLDSDDFDSVDFRIKLKNTKDPVLLLRSDYKDALNRDYSKEFSLPLEIRNAEDLGIATNNTSYVVLFIILIAIVSYFIYKKYRPKKKLLGRI